MTTNAFLFSWCEEGIEAIVPITQYEDYEEKQVFNILKTNQVPKCPLDPTLNAILMRARFNHQRHYEVYVIDCDESFTEDGWRKLWEESPQTCADLVRKRGIKLHSDRRDVKEKIR